jgi:hypothetical protein
VANDGATQTIVTHAETNKLSEIVTLLRDSMELNRRELEEVDSAADTLISQMTQNHNTRDGKAVLDSASKLAAIMNLAVDVAPRLQQHSAWIFGLIDKAKAMF